MQSIGEELLKQQKNLYSYALHLTKNSDEAKELLQETAVNVLCNSCNYRDRGLFTPWAHTIMRNAYINNLKKRSKYVTDGYDTIQEYHTTFSVTESESCCYYNDIQSLIDTLPPMQASTFTLAFTGYSYNEIAKKTGSSLSNVKNHIHAARINLRKKLAR